VASSKQSDTLVAVLPSRGLDAASSRVTELHPDTVHLVADSGIIDRHDRIAAWAIAQRPPSFSTISDYAKSGGLIAYGVSLRDLVIRACYFVRGLWMARSPETCRSNSRHGSLSRST
jgi:hypothetical protein